MNKKQAKAELEKIMKQKTVSINRLQEVLNVLDYRELERAYINQGGNIKSLRNKEKERIKQVRSLEGIINRQRVEINYLRGQ